MTPDHVDTTTILETLAEKLPKHMVPVSLTPLSTFPTTPNGKIDKKQLPEIDIIAGDFVEPISEEDIWFCRAFADALQVTSVGMEDNFFQLGGHSLLAMKLATQLNCKSIDILQTGTVGGLLLKLKQDQQEQNLKKEAGRPSDRVRESRHARIVLFSYVIHC